MTRSLQFRQVHSRGKLTAKCLGELSCRRVDPLAKMSCQRNGLSAKCPVTLYCIVHILRGIAVYEFSLIFWEVGLKTRKLY